MIQASFYWPEDLAERVRHASTEMGISMSDFIRWALSEKVKDSRPSASALSNQELIDEVRRRQQATPSQAS